MNRQLAKVNAVTAILCLIAALSIAAQLDNRNQVCDIISQCKLIFAITSLGLAVILSLQKKWTLLTVAVSFLILNSLQMVPLFFAPKFSHTRAEHESLKVMTANLDAPHNKDYKTIFKQIETWNPDVIGFVEVNNEWRDTLQKKLEAYKFSIFNMEGGGVALFSKLPMDQYLPLSGKVERPKLQGGLSLNGKTIFFELVHLMPPTQGSFTDRKQEFMQLAIEAQGYDNRIVFGDFNCAPWTNKFQKLLTNGDLNDTENGHGFQPTWPANFAPPIIPIDHILTSKNIRTSERRISRDFGSDHLSVLVECEIEKD
jgi:endonuclease/exonuclease/phosphatase (EEP) superfamily protein YafD